MATQPNIRAAIERSRRARDRIARRRRRTALAASLCIAAAVPLSLSLIGVTRGDLVQAAVTGGQSLSDLLNQRSPGARTAAQLTKTKRAHALAKLRQAIAPPGPLAPLPVELAKALLPPDQQLPVDLGPPLALLQTSAPTTLSAIVNPGPGGVIGSSPAGSGGSPPGGGGGGPGTFPTQQPQQPQVPVPSPVPEPGTWATMLLGFGLLGWRFRRGLALGAKPARA